MCALRKNNFIQEIDGEYILFNNDKPTVGFIIINNGKLEYNDLEGNKISCFSF